MAHLSVKLRLLILALIDSLIVTFSVFVSYYILEPYFQNIFCQIINIGSYITIHIASYFSIYF
ncbi:UDP-D-quinovosamine 4-dehydrogenase [Staphylococcus aureus]|uniref:UDP-D-quinovosamine 4-dehydrogenase n=1 Tax=Staphylococcus aureus TaxID=1280 RepID=A0A380DME9_STAAU|nr:UDP-D-quinovosamine 4-dehydrogenase [Staphylococcus aureus]